MYHNCQLVHQFYLSDLIRHHNPDMVGCVAQLKNVGISPANSLSCAWPAADEWPLMWVNRPLQVGQLGQLNLSFFRVDKLSSKAVIGCVLPRLGGAIWWMLTRWWQGVPEWIVSNLALFVLGSVLSKLNLVVTRCTWPASASQHWLLVYTFLFYFILFLLALCNPLVNSIL